MVTRWVRAVGILTVLALAAVRPASADLFDQIFTKGGAKKKNSAQSTGQDRRFKFVVYLTTGDVLKAEEYKGGSSSKNSSFRFISNFESDIDVKTNFIKYVDIDMIGDQTLEEEYTQSKADRVYLKNQDYLTGKIVGFTSKDVLVTTTYGDLKADITQIRYLMFRNPAAMSQSESAPASTAPASATPSSTETK